MVNRRAPLACLSPRERGRWLSAVYPQPEVRERIATELGHLAIWALGVRRGRESQVWADLAGVVWSTLDGG